MKKILLVMAILVGLLSGCQNNTDGQFTDFITKVEEINTLVTKRGYQPAEVVAQYSRFDYVFPQGHEALAIEYVNDINDSFTIAFYANFTESDKLPPAISPSFIAAIVEVFSGNKFNSNELAEFMTSDAYLKANNNENVYRCLKEKGDLKLDDYIFYLEVFNSGFGYFEVSGLVDTAVNDAYRYNTAIQKVFKKFKYTDFTFSYSEVVLLKPSEISELSIVLRSNSANDLIDIYFSKVFSVVFLNKLPSAKERIKNIDIDLCQEIIELLSSEEMDMNLLHNFLFDPQGQYEIAELDEGYLKQKFYMSDTQRFMLNYELQNDFTELFAYHFFAE